LLHNAEGSRTVELSSLTAYDHEIRQLIEAIAEGRSDLRATLDDAAQVMRTIEAERRSLETGTIIAM
jgi:predicted dehydrogenase